MKLEDMGWNSFFSERYEVIGRRDLIPGRVVSVTGPLYGIETGKGRSSVPVSGHFQYVAAGSEDYPAVGDWVLLRGDDNALMIERVLDRRSTFSRRRTGSVADEQVIAANIDIMFIVASLDGGRNFNLRAIERYIVMVNEGKAEPVLLLNKCDLCADSESFLAQARTAAHGIKLFAVSAMTGYGMEQVTTLLKPGVTAAFTGPSGAGKSALINFLIGSAIQRTGNLREDDLRGRHTTTHRELFFLESGAMVIDTPGLRELSPYADTDSLNDAFSEIAGASADCRFKDCTHVFEPGCAVIELVEKGDIERDRYENFIKVRGEIENLDSLKSVEGRLQRKAKEKSLSKIIKEYYK